MARILLIDDEDVALDNLTIILEKEGYELFTASNGAEGLQKIRDLKPDLVLTDLRMPGMDGFSVLAEAKLIDPAMEVIIITGYATIDTAIEAMKQGAHHYVTKPYKIDEVRTVVREVVEKKELKQENISLKGKLEQIRSGGILTGDPAMEKLLEMAEQIAKSDCNVLITGESGTGKELLANFIHQHSPRREQSFLSVNCGVFSEELLASELFGYEKGAIQGAENARMGVIQNANQGTLLLDEITEMNQSMQVRLLRTLQEKEVVPVGSNNPVPVDVRFIGSTNRKIENLVKRNEFRQDLFFRINVVNLHLPPLTDRQGDIPLLLNHFINKYNIIYNKKVERVDSATMKLLERYDFPGNVRELEHLVERAVVLATGRVITKDHVPELELRNFRDVTGKLMSLEDYEQKYIEWVLMKCGGKKAKAAEVLGIDRVSLWRKLKKYGKMEVDEDDGSGPPFPED